MRTISRLNVGPGGGAGCRTARDFAARAEVAATRRTARARARFTVKESLDLFSILPRPSSALRAPSPLTGEKGNNHDPRETPRFLTHSSARLRYRGLARAWRARVRPVRRRER